MSINLRMVEHVKRILARDGFNVVIQRKTQASGDFDTSQPSWADITTVKAIWQVQGYAREALQDGGAASQTRLTMYLEYMDELKSTQPADKFRVAYNGVLYNISAAYVIGDKVATQLMLEDGIPA